MSTVTHRRSGPAVAGGATAASPSRSRWLAAAGVGGLLAFAYLWRLGVGTWQGDEITYADAGAAYLDGDFSLNREHPPLAKLLFGLGQVVTGDQLVGTRLVAAVCGIGVGVVLFWLVRRMAGWWPGLGVVAAWAALPHTLRTAGVGWDKLDRYGRLEAVAALPMTAALYAGWRWVEDGRTRWAVATGALAGLAAGAKATFGVVLVAVVAVVIHHASRSGGSAAPRSAARRQELRRVARQAAASGAAAVAAFTATYLPLGGEAWPAFTYMLRFQAAHAAAGHAVALGGEVYAHAPWWANLWFQWRDDGPLLTVALIVTAVAAVAVPSRLRGPAAYLAVAVVVPMLALLASPVALPHYRFAWLPQLVAVAVLGITALWRIGAGGSWSRASRATAVVAAVALAAAGAVHLAAIARLQPTGYARVGQLLAEAGVDNGRVAVRGYDRVLARYVPEATLVADLPADAVVLDPAITDRRPAPELAVFGRCRMEVDRIIVAFPHSCP